MALFKKDTTEEKKTQKTQSNPADTLAENTDTTEKKEVKEKENVGAGDMYWVLKRPHITEKTTDLSVQRAYVFDVDSQANKNEIKKAVAQVYNVTPVKVRTMNQPSKQVRTRKGMGTRTRAKKAIVYLKEGDTIQFI